jgi:hypothetical protein
MIKTIEQEIQALCYKLEHDMFLSNVEREKLQEQLRILLKKQKVLTHAKD